MGFSKPFLEAVVELTAAVVLASACKALWKRNVEGDTDASQYSTSHQ